MFLHDVAAQHMLKHLICAQVIQASPERAAAQGSIERHRRRLRRGKNAGAQHVPLSTNAEPFACLRVTQSPSPAVWFVAYFDSFNQVAPAAGITVWV